MTTETTAHLLEHLTRLDRLYLAADAALAAWQTGGNEADRWRYHWRRLAYLRAVAEGERLVGSDR